MRFTNLTILTLLVISSCGQKELLNTDKKIENRIKSSVTSGLKTLDLKTITDFTWDSLLIITPYANYDNIEKDLNIDLSKIKHTSIESRDDVNQLIFYYNGEPFKMIEYPRQHGDIANNKIEFIYKDSATFDIIVTSTKETSTDWVELKRRS
jgi:hypothetical protein